MGNPTFVFYEMKGDQFRKDIKANLTQPLVYPLLPKTAKGFKAVAGKTEPFSLRVVAEVDDAMYKKLAADAGLLDLVRKDFNPLYEKCCKSIADAYVAANKKFAANIVDGDQAAAEVLAAELKKTQVLVDQMGKAAQKVWDDYRKTKSDYAKYQLKIATTVTLASVVLIAGVAIIASTPFHFGVGTFFGIAGVIKATMVLVTELGAALTEPLKAILDAEKLVQKIFDGMEKEGKPGEKVKFSKKWKAKLYTAEVINMATHVALSVETVNSLGTLKDAIKLADNKVKGLEVKWHKITKKITEYDKRLDHYKDVTKPQLAKMIAENDWSQGCNPVGFALFMESAHTSLEEKLALHLVKVDKVARLLFGWADAKDSGIHHVGLQERVASLHAVLETMLEKPEVRNLERFGKAMEVLGLIGNLAMAGAGGASFDTSAAVDAVTHAGDLANVVIIAASSDLTGEMAEFAPRLAALLPASQHQFVASLG